MKILYLYISKQFLKSFALLISIFTLVVVSSQMMHLPKFVYSMNLIDFGKIILLLNLSFAKLQIFFGFFIAWLLVGIKLKDSNEVYAIYSLGVKKFDLIKPAILWGTVFTLVALLFSTILSPYANRERAKFLTVKVRSYLLESIQPQAFSKVSNSIYIYVDKKKNNRFSGIIIQNLSNGFIITAKDGYFMENFVMLEDGYIQIPTQDSYSVMSFKRYSFSIDVSYLKDISLEDMETTKLIKMILTDNQAKYKALAVITDRFTFPIPFLMVGAIGFLTGASFYRLKETLLGIAIIAGVLYVFLNHLFLKLIEKNPFIAIIYPAILSILLVAMLRKIYKSG